MLRESIAQGESPVPINPLELPQSNREWQAWIDVRDAARTLPLKTLEAQYAVSIQREVIAGVTVRSVVPANKKAVHAGRLFIHLHGGAYLFFGGDASVGEAVRLAAATGMEVLSIDYRMPPSHPFPAALDDVIAVYRHLLSQRSAQDMVLGGTSAGGGLALASVHQMKQLGLALPAGIFAGTPWADLSKTGDSMYVNAGIDRVLVSYEGLLSAAAKLYAAGRPLDEPLISPVYGGFDNFPPVMLVTGTRDLFLSDTVRCHRKLRAAGVAADLHVYEGLSHGEYWLLPDSPESYDMQAELNAFLARHWK